MIKNVTIKGTVFRGKNNLWSAISEYDTFIGTKYYLMENDTFGDEANYIIIHFNKKDEMIVDEWDWNDSLEEWYEN